MYLNNVTLTGFVGGDAQTRSAKNNSTFTIFSLATKESWKDRESGQAGLFGSIPAEEHPEPALPRANDWTLKEKLQGEKELLGFYPFDLVRSSRSHDPVREELKIGDQFLTQFKNERPGLDNYCVAIADFNPEAVMSELNRQGLKPRRPTGTDRIYFLDPDGLEVQLSSADHRA